MNIKWRQFNLFSPITISSLVFLVSLAMCLVLNGNFSAVIGEKNFMQGNVPMLANMTFCVCLFVLGCLIADRVARVGFPRPARAVPTSLMSLAAASVCLFSSLLLVYFIAQSYSPLLLLSSVLSPQSNVLRLDINDIVVSNKLAWCTPAITGAVSYLSWWCIRRRNVSGRLPAVIFVYLVMISGLVTNAILLNKGPVFSILLIISLQELFFGLRLGTIRRGVFLRLIAVVGFFVGAFILFQSAKVTSNSALYSLYGYFPASYNRYAALVNGALDFPVKNSAYYTLQGIWYFPFVSSLIDVGRVANLFDISLPLSGFDNWQDNFAYIRLSGLNGDFIWLTVFGASYQDYSWYNGLWFFFYGLVAWLFWASYKEERVIGIVAYPSIMLSFQWWSMPNIFGKDLVIIMVLALILGLLNLFERGLVRRGFVAVKEIAQ